MTSTELAKLEENDLTNIREMVHRGPVPEAVPIPNAVGEPIIALLTDEEFSKWTRHKAENLMIQRDDAIARIAAAEAETVKVRTELLDEVEDKKKALAVYIQKVDKAVVELSDKYQKDAESIAQEKEVVITMLSERVAAQDAELAAAKKLVEDLGGTELAIKLRKEAEANRFRDELSEKIRHAASLGVDVKSLVESAAP